MGKGPVNEATHYIAEIPEYAFREAVWTLYEGCASGTGQREARAALDLVNEAEHPFRVGVRSSEGEWLAVAAGWSEGATYKVSFQLTSRRAPQFCIRMLLGSGNTSRS